MAETEERETEETSGLEALLEYLRRARGFDFTGYKRPSLRRRIERRMQSLGIDHFAKYQEYLELHQEEFARLFDEILINATSFFRDPEAWAVIEETVVPRILASKGDDEPIRVWSAGCAAGQEAYTIAMVLAGSLGMDQFHGRVKIYATDIDEDALARARQAIYTLREAEAIPPKYREQFLESLNGNASVAKELRRQVIIGRHNLLEDSPISRVDLLVCRNTLMYFNAETQARILARFHFALNPNGTLMLGRAETLFTYSHAFTPLDAKRRISVKVPRSTMRERGDGLARNAPTQGDMTAEANDQVRQLAFDTSPVAQLAVDRAGNVTLINQRARMLFGISARDVGRSFQNLQLSYRPLELRSRIDQAIADRRIVIEPEVEWRAPGGEIAWLDIRVAPLLDGTGEVVGALLSFADSTHARRLRTDLEEATHELETANEELQSTNEELETTNEELQSTIEELETTNEELHSTNEELETINEELQSTNEELETTNDALRARSGELNSANEYLESILMSLRSGVLVLDRELGVRSWNRSAEELWGLRGDEVVGQNFLALDIGLPVADIETAIRATLSSGAPSELTMEATNRRGKRISCVVTCSPLGSGRGQPRGVILLMEATEVK